MAKICFKCGVQKELSEFYVHPQMADGHLNKCKECNKKDTKNRQDILRNDPNWLDSERTRGRKKYHRLYIGTGKAKPHNNKAWQNKYPEKKIASSRSSHVRRPGFEKHHWSYNEPHYKDVVWLTKKHHMKAHRFLVYDQEQMMYRRYDTMELLDTKDRHEAFIKHCIETKED